MKHNRAKLFWPFLDAFCGYGWVAFRFGRGGGTCSLVPFFWIFRKYFCAWLRICKHHLCVFKRYKMKAINLRACHSKIPIEKFVSFNGSILVPHKSQLSFHHDKRGMDLVLDTKYKLIIHTLSLQNFGLSCKNLLLKLPLENLSNSRSLTRNAHNFYTNL